MRRNGNMAQESNDVKQELVAIADELDRRGLKGMADEVTQILAEIVHEERVAALPDPEYLVEVADQLDQEGRYDEADQVTAYAQRVAMVRTAQGTAQNTYFDPRIPAAGGGKGWQWGGSEQGFMNAPAMIPAGNAEARKRALQEQMNLANQYGRRHDWAGRAAPQANVGRAGGGMFEGGLLGGGYRQRARETDEQTAVMQRGLDQVTQLKNQIKTLDTMIQDAVSKNNAPLAQQLRQQKLSLMQQGYRARQMAGMNPGGQAAANPAEQAEYAKAYGLQA